MQGNPATSLTVWCPYTGKKLARRLASSEHVIPLALGGCNELTILVDSKCNSQFGAKIDGVLANDPLIMFRRSATGTKGHSGRQPLPRFKGTFEGRPAQVTFHPGQQSLPQIWDAKTQRDVPESVVAGKDFGVQMTVERFSRLRFVAKVSLAAGYLIYGDLFRNNVKHAEPRLLAQTEDWMSIASRPIKTRFLDRFASPMEQCAGKERDIQLFCEATSWSLIVAVPTSQSLIISVGILGHFVGSLNIPAIKPNLFPRDGEHDLGHCLVCANRRLRRLSLRKAIEKMLKELENRPPAR
jgi:hypothetical protein